MKPYAVLPFILQIIAWPVAHLIFRINGTFVVHGREHLKDLKEPIIFASNHLNELDPVVQRAILPMFSKPLFWIARPRGYYTWTGWRASLYGEWFFRSWGAYPAYKGFQDYERSLQHHLRIINDGFSVGIFPQGLKAKDQGPSAPTHGGVAFLAHRTGRPIVPVAIHGTRDIDALKLFFGKKRIEITILQPVFIAKKATDYQKEAQRTMQQIHSVA